jgi:hypothetical protein
VVCDQCEEVLGKKNTSGLCKRCYQRDYMRRRRRTKSEVATRYEQKISEDGSPDEYDCVVKGCKEEGAVWVQDKPLCIDHAEIRMNELEEDLRWLRHGLNVS